LVSLKQEIAQQSPFTSMEEEALLNLLRTADAAERGLQRLVRPWGITGTQYNVLRILRGSEPQGLTCSAVGSRMITAEPDITRLIARLKAMKLARQQRDKQDRRVVWTRITAEGLRLLAQIDPEIASFPAEFFARLTEGEKAELIRLLEKTRSAAPDPVTCDGSHRTGNRD
jgi:DNA-binding MarR family transcriptional regulator